MAAADPRDSTRLVLCSVAALFWELALIRWQGSCVRVVAYYSNFVLIAAFFGLGAGALLARRRDLKLERFLFPALCVAILLGVALGRFAQLNPIAGDEFVWLGNPQGVDTSGTVAIALSRLPFWVPLGAVYLADAAVFVIFGQWMGRLFRQLPPLRAYSLEIAGSVLGILTFGALSALRTGPVSWFAIGSLLALAALERTREATLTALACAALYVGISLPFARQFVWSPYYKIEVDPLQSVSDAAARRVVAFDRPIGYTLEVNNDYHQMMLDLAPRKDEPEFLRSWRLLYELPYRNTSRLPPGPILVVGAGTGNDVAAALRSTDRRVDAVDIDPVILAIGGALHPERPYASPRVRRIVDDARSHFERTPERYALVVFGFLDSHTLLSSFSSLRLDNFVYTREALRSVRELLLPGGEVYLTFAVSTPWIRDRMIALMDEAFDGKTQVSVDPPWSFSNGVVYRNGRSADGTRSVRSRPPDGVEIPTDDWPFLYLKSRSVPAHYRGFMALVVALGFGAMWLVPRGERRIRFPYFFMGAAFFLIETSNVVRLSLLYGSTWTVNLVVFSGILLLVLAGNLISTRLGRFPLSGVFALLALSIAVAYFVPTSALLSIASPLPRAAAAVAVFLGPVLFASLIFAVLIREEDAFYQAYGSNVLGAVVGGACEYLSLLVGFRALLPVTLGLYALVFVLVLGGRSAAPGRGGG